MNTGIHPTARRVWDSESLRCLCTLGKGRLLQILGEPIVAELLLGATARLTPVTTRARLPAVGTLPDR